VLENPDDFFRKPATEEKKAAEPVPSAEPAPAQATQ